MRAFRFQQPVASALILAAMLIAAVASHAQAQSAASAATRFRIAGAGVVSPDVVWPIYPAPLVAGYGFSLFAPPAPNLGFPQPLGSLEIWTGPNSYVTRNVYDLGDQLDQARQAMRAGDYQRVLVDLEPVLSERPDDGQACLLQAHAQFALGQYASAALALQGAMSFLPQEEWGRPVVRAQEYYPSRAEFTARLRALEQNVRSKPGEGAGHYLLGYFYGYLGRLAEAEKELKTALRVMTGDDRLAEALTGAAIASPTGTDRPRPGLPGPDVPPPVRRGPREF